MLQPNIWIFCQCITGHPIFTTPFIWLQKGYLFIIFFNLFLHENKINRITFSVIFSKLGEHLIKTARKTNPCLSVKHISLKRKCLRWISEAAGSSGMESRSSHFNHRPNKQQMFSFLFFQLYRKWIKEYYLLDKFPR